MRMRSVVAFAFAFTPALVSPLAHSAEQPGAIARSNASNFKDMILGICLARVYAPHAPVAADAGSSANALVEWTLYDAEKSPEHIEQLVGQFTRRNYANPLAESEQTGVKFDLLKCLDLYHSRELDALVKRVVLNPGRNYRESGRARK